MFSSPLDGRPAGVVQPQQPPHLIECLSSRIIKGAAQSLILAVAAHENQLRVAAGHHQAEHGENNAAPPLSPPTLGGRKGGQPIGVDMGLDVIDSQQGQPTAQGNPLGGVDADQQGTRQAWPIGHSHGLQAIPGYACLVHSLLDDRGDGEDMLAGGHLGEDTAIAAVNVYLGGDHVGENSLPVLHHRCRRLVARCFDA